MENKKHLPMMGAGPVYVAVIIDVTVIAVLFLLDIYDCADEMHGRKVAEKSLWQGI